MKTEILKSLVKRYNKERTLENWILLENNIDDKHQCKDCGGSIFYHNSLMRVSKYGILKYDSIKTSCKTYKEIDEKVYYLNVCQKCIEKKFPEYLNMNKSRVFNVMNKITIYAFGIPYDVAKSFTKTTAVTLINLQKKYGEVEGLKRWEEYKRIQGVTNTLEYKKEKYGWTHDDFDVFNKSRAITIPNMIKKHGEEMGLLIFNSYIEKQRVNGKTLDYFIEKLGDIEGRIKYKEISMGKARGSLVSGSSYSKVSQEFFDKIDGYLGGIYKTYYASKNYEKIIYIDSISKCYMLDYYIKDINVCIEFNGDYYHANPNKYPPDFKFPEFSHCDNILTSKDIWEKDKTKIRLLRESRGIKTIVVWESNYYKNKDNEGFYKKIIKECIEK